MSIGLTSHIEIFAAVQIGPARCDGARGSWLDFTGMGQLGFWVEQVTADGARLTLHDTRSYEEAIVTAEECARDVGVHVVDLVCAS